MEEYGQILFQFHLKPLIGFPMRGLRAKHRPNYFISSETIYIHPFILPVS